MGTILTAFLNYEEWQLLVAKIFVVIANSYVLAGAHVCPGEGVSRRADCALLDGYLVQSIRLSGAQRAEMLAVTAAPCSLACLQA